MSNTGRYRCAAPPAVLSLMLALAAGRAFAVEGFVCEPASAVATLEQHLSVGTIPADVDEAKNLFDCILENYGGDSPELANASSLVARTIVKRSPAHTEQARFWADQAVGIFQRRPDLVSATTVSALSVLRDVYWVLEDDVSAVEIATRVEQIVDTTAGFGWAQRIKTRLENAGRLGSALQFSAAEEKYRETLRLAEDNEQPEGELVAECLYWYSKLLLNLAGEPWRARPLLERALTIRQARANDPVEIVRLVNAVGVVYQRQNDLEPAREWLERGLRTRLSLAGYAQPDGLERMRSQLRAGTWKRDQSEILMHVGQSLLNLGNLAREHGDLATARDRIERTVETWEIARPIIPLDIAEARSALAEVRLAAGEPVAARQLAAEAVSVVRAAPGPERHRLPHLLVVQARAELTLHHASEALALVREALTAESAQSGPDRPALATMQLLESECLEALDQLPEAIESAVEAERSFHAALVLGLRALPERVALELVDGHRQSLERLLHLALASSSPQAVTAAWEAAVRSRAIVMDEIVDRARLMSQSRDPAAAAAVEALHKAQQRRALLLTSDELRQQGVATPQRLEHARRDVEQAERELAALELPRRPSAAHYTMSRPELKNRLLSGSALISYARIAASGTAGSSYLAFVLRPNGTLTLVRLADSSRVESLAKRWLREAGSPLDPLRSEADSSRRLRQVGTELRRVVLDPVLSASPGVDTLLLVPDGILHLVNFAALPRGDGRFMVESAPSIVLLGTERDLLDHGTPSIATHGLLAVGGPDYDIAPSAPEESSQSNVTLLTTTLDAASGPSAARGSRSTCREFTGLDFAPLDFAKREAVDVGNLWRRGGRTAGDALVLTAAAATESAVKRFAPGRRALHLATHGFMIHAGCTSEAGMTKDPPLLLAGLALAGANFPVVRADEESNDGLLTAEEVAALPLDGMEWVVLSACDTALGDLSASDGILGLKRAFRVSGVQAQISSLWQVADEDARNLMLHFYRAALGGESVSFALDRAMRETLADRRRRGLSDHPRHWAPFVATVTSLPGPRSPVVHTEPSGEPDTRDTHE